MKEQQQVTLETLKGGAISDLFKHELGIVIENVMDINTDWRKKRKVSIVVTFAAHDEDRENVTAEVQVESKLAPQRPLATLMSIGTERKGEKMVPVAYEIGTGNPNQLSFVTADDFAGGKR